MTHKQKHLKKNRLPNWVIVALVLIGSVLLTWMLSAARLAGQVQKDREGFQKAEAAAAATIDELSSLLGEPLYVDKNNRYSYEIVGKNPEEQLYCDTLYAAYYALESDRAEKLLATARAIVEKQYSSTMLEAEYDHAKPVLRYMFGSHDISTFNNLSCAGSVRYPERSTANYLLPERRFEQNNIAEIAVHCNKHVAKRVY